MCKKRYHGALALRKILALLYLLGKPREIAFSGQDIVKGEIEESRYASSYCAELLFIEHRWIGEISAA